MRVGTYPKAKSTHVHKMPCTQYSSFNGPWTLKYCGSDLTFPGPALVIFASAIAKLAAVMQSFMAIDYGNTGCGVFNLGGTKLERFLPKNQHTQRKLLNFENWVNGHHFRK